MCVNLHFPLHFILICILHVHVGVQLSNLHWNPQEYPEQLAVSTSDGTLQLLAVIDDVRVEQQKVNLHANAGTYTCIQFPSVVQQLLRNLHYYNQKELFYMYMYM